MYSRVSYTANGTQTVYVVPFPVLAVSSLQVRLNTTLLTYGTDYVYYSSTNNLMLNSPPADGVTVSIKRVTPRGTDERLVVFTDPSKLTADTLNKSDLQLLYIIQEALDDISEGIGVGGSGGSSGGSGGGGNVLDDPDLGPVFTDIINAHNTTVAALQTEVNNRAAAVLAEHDARVAALLAEAGNRATAILSAKTEVSDSVSSLASVVSVVAANTDSAHSRITSEETARTTAVSAVATRVGTLESTLNTSGTGLLARITTVEQTLVSGSDNTALAYRVTSLETSSSSLTGSVSTLSSRITSEEASRTSADSSLGYRIDGVVSSVGSVSASVTAEATTRSTQTGNLSGQYVLKVSAGNRVAGMRITSVSNPASGDTSEIVFDAASFKVYNGASNIAPFVVQGNTVTMPNVEAQVLKVGSGLLESYVTSGLIKQGNFTTANSGLATLSSWLASSGNNHSISILASSSLGYLNGSAYLMGYGTAGSGFTISADGYAKFTQLRGSDIEFHPNSGANRCNITTGEDSGTVGAQSGSYLILKINGRSVWVPFFNSVP
jgi:hypothetical protein